MPSRLTKGSVVKLERNTHWKVGTVVIVDQVSVRTRWCRERVVMVRSVAANLDRLHWVRVVIHWSFLFVKYSNRAEREDLGNV